jgi:hypothetical protein
VDRKLADRPGADDVNTTKVQGGRAGGAVAVAASRCRRREHDEGAGALTSRVSVAAITPGADDVNTTKVQEHHLRRLAHRLLPVPTT